MAADPFADTRFFTHASLPVAAAYCRTLNHRYQVQSPQNPQESQDGGLDEGF